MKTFFNIALSGLSEVDARKVLQTLESPKLGNWSLSEGGTSDLLVIDVDSVWGHMDWLRAVADGRRCAAYTEQESMRDCDLLLRKPLDAGALIEILLEVQGGPQAPKAKPAGAKAAQAAPAPATRPAAPVPPPRIAAPAPVPAPDPAPVAQAKPAASTVPASAPVAAPAPAPAAASAKPVPPKAPEANSPPVPAAPVAGDAASSVGALLLAGGIDTQVLVKDGDTTLFIDPSNNVYRAPPQLKPLEKLLAMPAARLSPVGPQDPQVPHAGPEQPIVRLLWFAALSASDGKLAPHLDPSSIWKLTRWPQIEREFPRHFRIATAMMKQAGTLEDVAEAAKSPVADVASFINAYYVAGYVAAEGSDEPEDAANSTANVLSRLRRTFSRGTRQATS